jgi:hypothetical protein
MDSFDMDRFLLLSWFDWTLYHRSGEASTFLVAGSIPAYSSKTTFPLRTTSMLCMLFQAQLSRRSLDLAQESLRSAIQNFFAQYHAERNHQGLANRLISPEASAQAAC